VTPSTEPPFGTAWARFGGHVVDSVLMTCASYSGTFFGAFVATLMAGGAAPKEAAEKVMAQGAMVGWLFWSLAFGILNYVALQGLTGASVGKRVAGLRVVRDDGRELGMGLAALRLVSYMASSLPFYLGYLAIFWSDRRQCWHDSLCGTVVVKRGAVYPARTATVLATLPNRAGVPMGDDTEGNRAA
jgi:uncharacterized RDD family membrane protein YckC